MPYKDKEKQKEAQRQHYLNNKSDYVKHRRMNIASKRAWL
jgi:hypothetical protein